ncbi:hypothetical protein F4553_006471 [Allocatelliglobosispora scoriae]|uniref:NUDIX hydrolase n=1 Tax=Allocatelliglobosispora scoriae TaxID=643052 RepID=A0A841BVB5_9ACTN|nr:hypothetical protein [Allocatelliglobosispora scoriae]MBB5873037.1 hypothetical protein [Allocatelliglobosispora scoriae]
MGWVVSVVVAVVLVGTYVTWLATRIDRLHQRAHAARGALDAQLMRRAAAAAVLAEEREVGPLYPLARAALDATEEREAAENDLTHYLRKLDADPADGLVDAVVSAERRVRLARQVHTDSVRDALTLREHHLVRLLRLTRRHPRPVYFDIDL